MAIAGWLVIGLGILVLVAVVNNSWQPLLDRVRESSPSGGAASGGAGSPSSLPAAPALSPPPTDNEPIVEPGAPPTATA